MCDINARTLCWVRRFVVATLLAICLAAFPLGQATGAPVETVTNSPWAGPMSTLDPGGPAARSIAMVWWVMFWGSVVITAGMIALALHAFYRRANPIGDGTARQLIIWGGLVLPFAVVAGLLAYGLRAGHAMLPLPSQEDVPAIGLTGHQWWWEVQYAGEDGGTIHGANVIHIPAGRPVDIRIDSADVIHAFWIPRLGGKIDAIPGRTNVMRVLAEQPGIYRGQCAEFCGAQHARMGLVMIAHADEEAWRAAVTGLRRERSISHEAGRDAFAQHCIACHSRDAARRGAGIGPNLANIADRESLGAGTLKNDFDNLQSWIADAQAHKPGNHMQDFSHLDQAEIGAIASYLLEIGTGDAP